MLTSSREWARMGAIGMDHTYFSPAKSEQNIVTQTTKITSELLKL
jgi:hypothetical protein